MMSGVVVCDRVGGAAAGGGGVVGVRAGMAFFMSSRGGLRQIVNDILALGTSTTV